MKIYTTKASSVYVNIILYVCTWVGWVGVTCKYIYMAMRFVVLRGIELKVGMAGVWDGP